MVQQICSRCNGAGGWKGWPGFTCFRCGGTGREPVQDVDEKKSRKAMRVQERELIVAGWATRECPTCHVWTMLLPDLTGCRLCAESAKTNEWRCTWCNEPYAPYPAVLWRGSLGEYCSTDCAESSEGVQGLDSVVPCYDRERGER